MTLATPGQDGKLSLSLETLRARKMPPATENFLFSLAASEGFVQLQHLHVEKKREHETQVLQFLNQDEDDYLECVHIAPRDKMLQVFQNNLLLLVQKSVNSVICYFKELERCCSSATENLKDSMKLRSKNFYANETLIYKRKKQEYSKGLLFLFFLVSWSSLSQFPWVLRWNK